MASSNRGIQIGSAWFQKKINLRPQHRGVHLVTEEILRQIPELCQFSVGLCHIQILHTSASLALNESWDPDVRDDMEMMLNKIVPEGMPYRHSCEGPDDMVSLKLGLMEALLILALGTKLFFSVAKGFFQYSNCEIFK
ncbi:UPF0047 protein YjbQ isoform X3 [Neodiprion fabricii]|uniref:UPF0047 protein YjbQ isoform X3 n=1 Tax=Neodiprion fabricii TaxID=2872261 RepID=UPI00076F9E74|nr:UPF0047 protein YjbQ isoform X3 [Neodiprion fabricii]XP_046472075.1 UPF0047 protein YjbQ isoform X3 [Neodiprion pinetum]